MQIEFDESLCQEIFDMIDTDKDNKVTLEEFVAKYLETREKLTEKLNETCKKIIDHKRQRDEMFEKLQ
jgi:uncharacterized coiled-coil DUF342 family protein